MKFVIKMIVTCIIVCGIVLGVILLVSPHQNNLNIRDSYLELVEDNSKQVTQDWGKLTETLNQSRFSTLNYNLSNNSLETVINNCLLEYIDIYIQKSIFDNYGSPDYYDATISAFNDYSQEANYAKSQIGIVLNYLINYQTIVPTEAEALLVSAYNAYHNANIKLVYVCNNLKNYVDQANFNSSYITSLKNNLHQVTVDFGNVVLESELKNASQSSSSTPLATQYLQIVNKLTNLTEVSTSTQGTVFIHSYNNFVFKKVYFESITKDSFINFVSNFVPAGDGETDIETAKLQQTYAKNIHNYLFS